MFASGCFGGDAPAANKIFIVRVLLAPARAGMVKSEIDTVGSFFLITY